MSNIDTSKLLDNVSNLPTLPAVMDKLTKMLQNPQTSAEEVGKVISTDQALAAKVLKLVNSAFYGFPGRISTITHAIVILGFATVKNIVLTASIFEAFKTNKETNKNFDLEKFWQHSIACGAAAQTIAKHFKLKDPESYFISGLIHDIGKIIMCLYLPQYLDTIIKLVNAKDILFYEAENELLELTHQDIGALLTQKWNLPENLINPVQYHHNPERDKNTTEISATVHLSDILIRGLDYGNGGDNKIPEISDFVWEKYELDKTKIKLLLGKIADEYEKAMTMLNN